MKIISVNIGDTRIEFDNNMWTGHESIYVNGELVSRKFSFFGTDHTFDVEEEGEWVEYVLRTGYGWRGVTASVRRNGVSIIDSGCCGLQVSLPKITDGNYHREDLV